ncbi:hypothetical protein [Aureispira anguillae]|uniref:Uncharacterized protein n=1 Tax=Aureispira anguillae TaxID=2864201 RepID=A0A915YE56_9BACT|nr:hypothetical protein [Aureispira anguillae]BDS11453.1 hypothetical protein AsAng_0021670 [Aureispira anguillae]
MDNNTLDNHLVKKSLKQIFSDVRKAGYRNSVLYQKGYIIAKKSTLVKVRIVLDENENAVVSTVPLGIKEILFNLFLLIIFVLLGGIFFIVAIGYVLISSVSFLVSLPKVREFKTEIEGIIR